MHACACHLPGSKQTRNGRSSLEVGLHAAHDVVRGRPHRNPIAREVEARPPAHFRNQRKPFVDEVRVQTVQRQIDGLVRAAAFTHDRARDAIARREITRRFVSGHERLARRIDELRTFSTQRLREEKPRLSLDHQRRGMKLNKLEIDDCRAGAVRHRDTISRRNLRVCGFVIHLPCTAGCEQHRSGNCGDQLAVTRQKSSTHAAIGIDHEINHARVIARRHAGQAGRPFPENATDLPPGCVACMKHAPGTVGRFHREREFSIRCAVELNSPGDQFAHEPRPILDENLDGVRIAQAITGGDRVGRVQLRRVTRADRRRNAPLRVTGVAFAGSAFCEDEDVAMAGDFGNRAKRGDTAADDEKVRAKLQAAPDAAILPSQKTMRSKQPRTEPTRLSVRTSSGSYTIQIACGLANGLRATLDAVGVPARRFIVSNQTVWRFHGGDLQSAVDEEPILIPDGERYKQLATVGRIYDALIRANADRSTAIVAIGGGVVGDVAGFAAATYLRGIPVVQVPTTLLAQVDSAVGGKVGVNHPMGKNLIGAFHPPAAVIVDPLLLSTLPRREFRAGLYEVVKYGVIASRPLFDRTAAELTPIFARDAAAVLPIVSESCQIKARIVEQDERESGLRRTLNFGHTAGHALEAVTKYRRFLHGEAVAYGMLAAAGLAAARGVLAAADRDALAAQIMQMGPLPPVSDLSAADIVEATKRDKKVIAGTLHFVLPTTIGSATTVSDVSPQELTRALVAIGLKE
jgi:3-dehydroquinate synthase